MRNEETIEKWQSEAEPFQIVFLSKMEYNETINILPQLRPEQGEEPYMNKPVLVVMAAGMGSRYGGMKQIDPVGPNGQVIVDYSLYDARRAGFETVIFVIKHEIEDAFKAAIGERVSKAMNVKYAFQQLDELPAGFAVPEGRVKPWGTCHAVLAAKDLIDGPFAVINADDYYGPEAFRVMYDYLSTHEDGSYYDYCMVSYLLRNTVSENGSVARGVCVTEPDGTLHSVTERTRIETYENGVHFTEDGGASWTDLPGDTPVSMNLWGFGKSFLDEAEQRFAGWLALPTVRTSRWWWKPLPAKRQGASTRRICGHKLKKRRLIVQISRLFFFSHLFRLGGVRAASSQEKIQMVSSMCVPLLE